MGPSLKAYADIPHLLQSTFPTFLHDGEFSSMKEGPPTLASCMPNEELKCKWCGVKEQPTLGN